MKCVRLALVFLACIVLAFAAPSNRQKKPFRPNSRILRQAQDETTTFRTYQPKYNPFNSSVLRTSSTSSVIKTNATLPMRSEFRFRQASLQKELSVDLTNISAPVEEPVTSSTDSTFSWSTDPELPIHFDELESSSPSSLSEATESAFSPLPTVSFSPSYVITSKPTVSTAPEPYVSTDSSSSPTSNTIPNAPVLLRPSTSLKPESPKPPSDSSFKPVSLLESIPSSTPKSLFSSLPRTNTLDPSSRVPKALESSPYRPPSITTQTSTSSSPVSTPLRSAKSLPSPPQSAGASVVPVSANNEPRSKLSSASSTSFVPSSQRSPKSATVQGGSTGFTNGVPTSYSFSYKVSDPLTKQDFGHSEKRVGNSTKGRYDVLLPDGRRQVVDYQVLDDRGYVADVTYQNS